MSRGEIEKDFESVRHIRRAVRSHGSHRCEHARTEIIIVIVRFLLQPLKASACDYLLLDTNQKQYVH